MSKNEYRSVVVPVLRWLNSLEGCRAINVHGGIYTERGTPDIMGVYRGRGFLLEAKATGGRLSALQRVRLRQWAAAGAKTAVVHSLEEVQRLWEEWF